jgi:hypothetical protein
MVPEVEIYCSDCEDFTNHELYDYNEKAEIWECTQCEDHKIISK